MRSLLVLLLDGLGDRASDAHGGRTANEAAHTPNLDALTGRGSCGLVLPLGPGRAPSSEVAHWAMLGYRQSEFPGRAVLEALGHGLPVADDEVLAFASARSVERRGEALWATGRTAAAPVAPQRINGLGFELEPLGPPARAGEGILRMTGGADDRVTDTDPFLRDRHPVMRPLPLVAEAAATARAVETWTRSTLRGDAIVTLKWWGRRRPAPSFRARHGLDAVLVGASPFLSGLATAIGLTFVLCPEGDDPAAAIRARLDIARDALDAGATFVFCHLKSTDVAGHTKDPAAKRRAIEAIDVVLVGIAERFADTVVCVTGDHATPTSPDVIHSGDPVPFLLVGPGVRADRVTRFGELDHADGILGRLTGADMMPVLLNAADRPLFLGSRPTATPHPMGFPVDVEPFRP
ncbi:MAG: phosphoglycerate mutase [Actinobacteria bacterium]|nr:phosphoglycerate mutase [Actinomycetota bacterium]